MTLINELTKTGRDAAKASELPDVARIHIRYVALGLSSAKKLVPHMNDDEVEGEFVRWTVRRSGVLRLSRAQKQELEEWLRGQG